MKNKCNNCNGTGFEPSSRASFDLPDKCKHCDGSGKIDVAEEPEKPSEEKIKQQAEILKMILNHLDNFIRFFDIPALKQCLQDMRRNNSTAEAIPCGDFRVLNKIEVRKAEVETFEALINLAEVRLSQMELLKKQSGGNAMQGLMSNLLGGLD